jgi:hypothetical protein
LGQSTFDVFSLLKSEYRYKSTRLEIISDVVSGKFRYHIGNTDTDLGYNFKTIYTFLEQRFDEKEIFALLEHLKILIKN